MTTLLDIYEAGGAQVSEDRTKVELPVGAMQPFDILLRVVPAGISMEHGRADQVTFEVLLNDEYQINAGAYSVLYHEASVALPVDQVRIAPKSVTGNISLIDQLEKLPAGTVIVGPDFNNEVYQTDGEVWWATGQEVPWTSGVLIARGPFHVLKFGDA